MQLQKNWQFREFGKSDWLPATVPGCVHTDLLNAGLIPDPFYRDNEKKLQWIEKKDWEYQTQFLLTANDLNQKNIDLVFKGLDTYADVYLNGHLILKTDNMFREWRVSCNPFVQAGKNTLRILFHSPVNHVLPQLKGLPYVLPSAHDQEFKTSPYTRKAPYQFGWDWGPRFVTMGIWKPIFLDIWETARISDVWIHQNDLSEKQAALTAEVEIQAESDGKFQLSLRSENDSFAPVLKEIDVKSGKHAYSIDLEIPNPGLWWPNGMGEPVLYTIDVTLQQGAQQLGHVSRRIGLRTIELRQKPDQWGESFEFVVNGVPLFAKGGNWIPADSFPSRLSEEDYRHLLQSSRDAHMNMIRVWGGGIYEADTFYDLCDEMGILVWQDFMFACSLYPGDSEFLENVKQEAVDQIVRLRNHPSLALWCGNNEIEASWSEWGWKKNLPDEVWDNYKKLFHHLLPDVCRRFDPDRPYWPSSPSSNLKATPSSPDRGDVHFWDVWHGGKPFEAYRDVHPRFVSEYGFQSFPEMASVRAFSRPEDWRMDTPVMLIHQKDGGGNQRIYNYMRRYYRDPKDFPSFLYVSQVLQAEGIKAGTEHFRRLRPRCMGSLYWQINDCWPVASWSSIDYFGRWKALHYYARRFYRPILVSPMIDNQDRIQVFIVSDEPKSVSADLVMELFSMEGKRLWESQKRVDIPPTSSRIYVDVLRDDVLGSHNSGEVFLVVRLQHAEKELSKNTLFFVPPKDLALKKPALLAQVSPAPEGFSITLQTDRFAKDVFLSLDSAEGFFTDNYFDLIPDRSVEIGFRTRDNIDSDSFRNNLRLISLVDSFL
ncbi:MAG: glycoside hydrolase family 2 protein [Calditrichaeota bacterium]|nr:glycoside hydrolase family 2 protein [Calditrichota bacterium]